MRELLKEIGRPQEVSNNAGAESLARRVDGAVSRIDAWSAQPQDVQQALLGLLSSLARHLQDEQEGSPSLLVSDVLSAAFSRMTRFSAVERPGYVNGLSRHNGPHGKTWIDDAKHWWTLLREHLGDVSDDVEQSPELALNELESQLAEGFEDRKQLVALVQEALAAGLSQSDGRLVSLLTPHQSVLKGARGLKTLKTALKDALRDEEDFEQVQDAHSPVPTDWPHFGATLDKRAVVLGGDPRPQALDRIRDAFGFAEIDWELTDTRRVDALATRVRKGSVDMVLLLKRFLPHTLQGMVQPACAEAGIPCVLVDTGYGVAAVRRSIDRALR
ncbi:MAG: hypothetical protein R3F61_30750 [Myxococcota bacterium]